MSNSSGTSTFVGSNKIAIITPSLARDLALCTLLNRTILEFADAAIHHYIVVDRRDREVFRPLVNSRTTLAVVEEIVPRGYLQIPRTRRWLSRASVVPIHGWLVQQLVKIAAVQSVSEPVSVMVDSDVMLVRDVTPSMFYRDGKVRLYRHSGGITPQMESHIAWLQNASQLLNVPMPDLPANDYIGNLISWDKEVVIAMCDRIEAQSGKRWDIAISGARRMSEYLLYGLFADNMPAARDRLWIDERPHCHTHWESTPIPDTEASVFIGAMNEDDVSVMVASHSNTSHDVRRTMLELATKGRMHRGIA